jgi:hypothetical protein
MYRVCTSDSYMKGRTKDPVFPWDGGPGELIVTGSRCTRLVVDFVMQPAFMPVRAKK